MMSLSQNLQQLFELDSKVRGLQSRLDSANRRLKVQTDRLEQYERQRDELAEQVKQGKAHVASLENEAAAAEEKINKLRQQMNQAKTNKEYSALLVEVNTLKTEKSKLEDQTLELMSSGDQHDQSLAEAIARVEDQSKLVEGAKQEVQKRQQEVQGQLDDLTARRREAEAQVPPDIAAQFRRLADAYEGEAMATVVEEDRRNMEYTCGGCFMTVPIERVNALMSKPDQITTCPSCNRILYLDEQVKTSIGVK